MTSKPRAGPATGPSPDQRQAADSTGIKGVFFDLGGTLFTYQSMPRRTGSLLIQAAEQLGVESEPRQIGKAYQQANKRTAVVYGTKDYYLHADLFRDVFTEFCTELGAEFDLSVWDDYRHKHDSAVIDALQIRADCRATLEQLRSRGLYLSVASNIDRFMLDALIERERLDTLFNDWTSSEEAQSCKPHAVFFDYTRDKSGLDASDILFVGDSPEHDILGAHTAGMRTALIAEPGVEAPLQSGKATVAPDFEISALANLLEILE